MTVAWMTVGLVLAGSLLGCSPGSEKPAPSAGDHDRRHVLLEGQPNFRDLGGYRARDGRTVGWGLVYRSGELSKLSDEDVATLERLGIRTVVDLRSEVEVEMRGEDRLPPGVRRVALPIEPGEVASPVARAVRSGDLSGIPDDLLAVANAMIVRDGTDQIGAVFDLLSDPANLPLVFHCTQGKDRSGVTAAVLLMALGIPTDTARGDYLQSNVFRHEANERELAHLRSTLAGRQGVDPEDVDMTRLRTVFYLQSPYFDAILEEIEARYGSFEIYLEDGLGLSPQGIEQLRQQLTE